MELLYEKVQAAGVAVERNLPLKKYGSFRIGGPASIALFPRNEEELLLVHRAARDAGVPLTVVGRGTNLLFPDEGIAGCVLFTTQMRALRVEGETVTAAAGTPLSVLARAAEEHSLTGAEFAHGIPGTLGGAVVMNAGAYDGSMAGILRSSRYYDTATGEVRELSQEEHGFDYRNSVYLHHPEWILLSVTLGLTPGERELIRARMEELARRRRESQPLDLPSAGSVFKRPEGHFAGRLIEECGLKGRRVGDAEVSAKHAGFIVNRGNATAADVQALISLVQTTVKERFGVVLECEIRTPKPIKS